MEDPLWSVQDCVLTKFLTLSFKLYTSTFETFFPFFLKLSDGENNSFKTGFKQVLFKNETPIDPNFTTIFTCSFYNFKFFDFFSGDDCGSCCGGSSTPPAPVFQTYASTLSGADRDNSCSSCDSCEEEDNSHKPVSRKAHQVCLNWTT